jgi:hypothetical protein
VRFKKVAFGLLFVRIKEKPSQNEEMNRDDYRFQNCFGRQLIGLSLLNRTMLLRHLKVGWLTSISHQAKTLKALSDRRLLLRRTNQATGDSFRLCSSLFSKKLWGR